MHKLNEVFYRNKMFLKLTSTKAVVEIYEKLRDNHLEGTLDYFLKPAGELGVKFKPKTRDEFLVDCRAALKRLLSVIVRYRLYGRYANAEVDLKLLLRDLDIALFGKIDIAAIPDKTRIVLADLKSELNKDYVDERQLKWYALLWYYKFGYYPSELLFIPCRGKEDAVQVEFTPEELQELMGQILSVRDQILADKKFAPRTNEKCWNCPERKTCPKSPYAQQHLAQQELDSVEGDTFSLAPDGENPFEDVFTD